MAMIPGAPYTGPLTLDATALDGLLFDLPKNAAHHLRAEKPGFDAVALELAKSVPAAGEAVGITKSVYERFTQHTATITTLRAARAQIEKLLEVVAESEAKYVDERENVISMMCDAVRSVVKRTGDEAQKAPFEATLRYNAQTAAKAAKTRRRNAGLEADEDDVEPAADVENG